MFWRKKNEDEVVESQVLRTAEIYGWIYPSDTHKKCYL